jgi:myo-inositol-1-phosphate synthase
MNKQVRLGIAGVGNNTSALVQGVHHYRKTGECREGQPAKHGVLFPRLCGFEIQDVVFTSAFDVDARKIGRDLGDAIFQKPNNYPRLYRDEIRTDVTVTAAPVFDGVPPFLAEHVQVSADLAAATGTEQLFAACVEEIRRTKTQVLLNNLPSGAEQATLFFARVAAAGGAAYVNCTPTAAAHSKEILHLFEEARLPLLGDDLESHFGSSLIHRTLLEALYQRGIEISQSYQINLGGNMDFKNLSHRSDAKKKSKMKALSPAVNADAPIDVLPSGGFVRGLEDRKVGYIVVEGRGWLGTPVAIDLKLQVQDSSNAAGMIIDLVRIAQGAFDHGLKGDVPLSYYFKNPVAQKLSTASALEAVRALDRQLSAAGSAKR